MYEAVKEILLELFRAPTGPPHPPSGTHDHIQIFRASPQFLLYQTFLVCLGCGFLSLLLIGIGLFILTENPVLGMILTLIFILLGIFLVLTAYFLVRLEYDMRYYIVTDRSLRIRKGVWNIVEQTLTFANIQNIKIEQGPIERLLGISDLVAETAGGGAAMSQQEGAMVRNYHRAVLSGLDNAESVRDLIMGYLKLQQPHTSGLGDPDEIHSHRVSGMGIGSGFSEAEIGILKEILSEVKQLKRSF